MRKFNNSNKNFSSHALSLEWKMLMLYDGLPMKGYNIIYLSLHIIVSIDIKYNYILISNIFI